MSYPPAPNDLDLMEPMNDQPDSQIQEFDAAIPPRPAPRMRPPRRTQKAELPSWAVGASSLWLALVFVYVLLVGGMSWTPAGMGALAAGICAPLVVIWLVALLQMRTLEAEAMTGPVRRQLAALLAPGAGAEQRVQRVTEALALQAEYLRHAATTAIDDSNAAMAALARQSEEMRRLSGGAMQELGRIGSTAEQTMQYLHNAMVEVSKQTGNERERAMTMIVQLEKNVQQVMAQVDRLSGSYEAKLSKLAETSDKLEKKSKNLAGIAENVGQKVDKAAGGVLGDLERLESAVAEVGQRSAAISHLLARPVESLESASRHLDTNMRQSQEMLVNATRNLEKIGDTSLARASSLVSTLSERLSSMELVGAKLVAMGSSAQADTGRYVAQIEAAAERIRTQAEQGQELLQKALTDFDSMSSSAIEQSTHLAEKISGGVDKLADISADNNEKFDALTWELENRTARLGDVGRDARAELEKIQIVLDNAQDSFAEQLERLGAHNSSLTQEISRSEAAARELSAATSTASATAEELVAAGDGASRTIASVSDLLMSQRASIEDMAGSIGEQIEALTATLAHQQNAIAQAASGASEHSDKTKAALQAQLEAITQATLNAAHQLDTMQSRLSGEAQGLEGMTARFAGSVADVAAHIQQQGRQIFEATDTLSGQQEALGTFAARTRGDLQNLAMQLTSTQEGAERAMDHVAAHLAALRVEIAKADQSLRANAEEISSRQMALADDNSVLSAALEGTLSRLQAMTGGLDSASRTLAAQGTAAGTLLEQAEARLLAAGGVLQQQSQQSESALAVVGSEIAVQQSRLSEVREAISAISSAIEETRQRMEAGEDTLTRTGTRARLELEAASDRLELVTDSLHARAAEGISTLEAVATSVENSGQSLAMSSDHADGRIKQLQADMASLEQILAALSTRSDQLAASLSHHALQAELASGQIQNATATANSSSAQLMTRMSELGDVAAAQHLRLSDMAQAIAEAEKSLEQSGERGQGALRSALAELALTGEKADAALAHIVERIQAAGSESAQEASTARALLADMADALRVTASELSTRVETAEVKLAEARDGFISAAQDVTGKTADLQKEVATLSTTVQKANGDLGEARGAVGSTAQDAARALESLIADIERLGQAGAANRDRLSEMNGSILAGLDALNAGTKASMAQGSQLFDSLQHAQRSMADLESQIGGVQSIVNQMADNSASRLAEVSSLFTRKVVEGENLINDSTARALAGLDQHVGSIQGRLDTMSGHTAGRMAEIAQLIGERIQETETQIERTARRTTEQVEQQVDALRRAGHEIAASTNDRLAEMSQQVENRIKDNARLIETTSQRNMADLTNQSEAVREATESLSERVRSQLAVAQEALARHVAEGESAVVSASQRSVDAIHSQVSTIQDMADRMAGHTAGRLAEVSELFTARIKDGEAQVAEAVGKSLKHAERYADETQQAADRMAEHTQARLREIAEQFGQRIVAGETAINQSVQRSMDVLEQSSGKVEQSIAQLSENASAAMQSASGEFVRRISDGEALLTGVTERLGRTGIIASEQASILDQVTADVENRLLQTSGRMSEQHTALSRAAEDALTRMELVAGRLQEAAEQSDRVQDVLTRQAEHNQQIIRGIADVAQTTTAGLEKTGQRMAMLAQQAAYDSARMVAVTERIEYQQASIGQAANEALSVLTAVVNQMKQAGDSGVGALESVQDKAVDAMMAMASRLSALEKQNDALMNQLRETSDRFDGAASTMREAGQNITSEVGELSAGMHSRALDLTAAGQQLERELRERMSSLDRAREQIEGTFGSFARHLAEIDTQASGYMIDIDRRSQDTVDRLTHGVAELSRIPAQVDEVQSVLAAQVDAARGELTKLRFDLVEIGHEVQSQISAATGATGALTMSLQDAGMQSRVIAEQIETAASQIVSASETSWSALTQMMSENSSYVDGFRNELSSTEGKAGELLAFMTKETERVLDRVGAFSKLVDDSIARLNSGYTALSSDGMAVMSSLLDRMQEGSKQVESLSAHTNSNFTLTAELLEQQQVALLENSAQMQARLTQTQQHIAALLSGFGQVDKLMGSVEPGLDRQRQNLDDLLSALNRVLSEVHTLQEAGRSLAGDHLAMAERLESAQSNLLTGVAGLDRQVARIDGTIAEGVLSRITAAVDQTQQLESRLGQLEQQTTHFDRVMMRVRHTLEQDVQNMHQAGQALSGMAERTASRVLEAGTALNATLGQLQKGGQISQATLVQTNDETQRLVLRLEQVRGHIKSMMGAISNDLTDWQGDMRQKIESSSSAAQQIGKTTVSSGVAGLMPPRVRVTAPVVTAGVSSAQLTSEALHALAVDIHRILHTEAQGLKREPMPPAARRQPMRPDEARSFTRALLEHNSGDLAAHIRALYKNSFEFRQYVDRYIARFEAQYDVLARNPQGLAEAAAYRESEVGQLYATIAGALERKSQIIEKAVG